MKKKNLGSIILAAGKGKRMKAKSVNKVTLHLANKPMILHTVNLIKELRIKTIVVVVGFAKKSVIDLLDGGVIFAEQKKRLGTAHAVSCALQKLPSSITDVLVLNGDDSAFYKGETIKKLIEKHYLSDAAFTLLTIQKADPMGLGRILRDTSGNLKAIVEEKDATPIQRRIKEVNPACYVFRLDFLKKYLKQIEKSPITREYYLTSLINIGINNKERIGILKIDMMPWRGVNTKDELAEAEQLFAQVKGR